MGINQLGSVIASAHILDTIQGSLDCFVDAAQIYSGDNWCRTVGLLRGTYLDAMGS